MRLQFLLSIYTVAVIPLIGVWSVLSKGYQHNLIITPIFPDKDLTFVVMEGSFHPMLVS